MKKLFLSLLILALMAGSAQAAGDLSSHSRVQYTGYSTAAIIIDTADPDSAVRKVVWFWGVTTTSVIRMDSLTTVTDPDSIAKAVGTFEEGETYYWYVEVTDSTTTIREPSDLSFKTFTTTDLQQNVSVIYTGYSTAGIMVDSAGLGIGVGLDSVRFDLDKTDGTTYSASITTVTTPQDTFAVTGLDEGVTYVCRTIAFLTDSSAADTLTAISFTTTDLGSSVSIMSANADSLIIIIDSVLICPDSLIVQWGAGLNAITAVADTNTSPNCPDTVTITGLIQGGTYSLRILYFLPDSSAIDTSSVTTYSRPHNRFIAMESRFWPSNSRTYLNWEFDSHLDTWTTGTLPITTRWLRIHVEVNGEDDFATSDSINVFLWSHEFGDSTAIDTLVVLEPDTITITPLKFRMQPSDYSDTSLVLHPPFNWGTHYSVSASMSNDDGQGDSTTTLGIRSVHVVIEEIQ